MENVLVETTFVETTLVETILLVNYISGNHVSGNCVSGNFVSENYVSGNRVNGIIPGDPFTGMNSSFNPGNRFARSCFGDLNNFHITAFMRLTCKGIVRKINFGLEKWVKKSETDL